MDAVPVVIGNCRILAKLGSGGMGAVYRAVHLTLQRHMAIKILPTEFTRDEEYVSRFLREARAIANLHHQNIVLVHDAGEQNGLYYIAMELVDGASLAAVTKYCGSLPEPVALDFMEQAAKGLAYAHRQGLVHRDIKPENLLVNREGEVKVVDFGLVLESSRLSHLTRTGSFLGTPSYMSPEQCDGLVADSRSDLYSLGATFYSVLAGHVPFAATSALGIMYKHKFEAPPPLRKEVSERTRELLFKLLEKKREDRYQDTSDLLADMQEARRALGPAPGGWSVSEVLKAVAPPLPPITEADLAAPAVEPSVTLLSGAGAPAGTPGAAVGATPRLRPSGAGGQAQMDAAYMPTMITPGQPGATPAPVPLPGALTPTAPPARAAPRRTGLYIALAAVVLVAVLVGGYWAYGVHRQKQLDGFIQEIERLAKDRQWDAAQQRAFIALASFPDAPRLYDLRKDIEKQLKLVQRKELLHEDLLSKAREAQTGRNYDEAVRLLEEAAKLGIEDDVRETMLRQVKYEKLNSQSMQAEKEGRLADALGLARQAAQFGGSEDRALRLESRVKVEELRAQAQAAIGEKKLLVASSRLEEAADCRAAKDDPVLRERLLAEAKQWKLFHLKQQADDAEGRQDWVMVVENLGKAVEVDAADQNLKQRLANAKQTLLQQSNYDSALKAGSEALANKQWDKARQWFSTALEHKKDSAEAKAKLGEAEARLFLDTGASAADGKEWRKARAALEDALKALPEQALPALKLEIERRLDLVKSSEAEISRKRTAAEQAEAAGKVDVATAEYQALSALNPSERQVYQDALDRLKVEGGYREELRKGDEALKGGNLKDARASYRLALEKKTDASSRALVELKLKAVDAADKVHQAQNLMAEKKWSEAHALLTKARGEVPANAPEVQALVDARLQEAKAGVDRVQKLESDLATAQKTSDVAAARAVVSELTQLNPARQAEYTQALQQLEAGIKSAQSKAARQARLEGLLADARKKQGQNDLAGALASAEQAQREFPGEAAAAQLVEGIQAAMRKARLDSLLADARRKQEQNDLPGALAAAQKALQEFPNDPALAQLVSSIQAGASKARLDSLLEEARRKQGQNDLPGALAAAQRALQEFPNDPTAAQLVGSIQAAQKAGASQGVIEQARQRVHGLYQGGQVAEALAAAQEAARQNPQLAELQGLAAALTSLTETTQAVAAADQALGQGLAALGQAPSGASGLKSSLESARKGLADLRSAGVKQFTARDYTGAQAAAHQAAGRARQDARSALEGAARSLDALAQRESSGSGGSSTKHVTVGEQELDTPSSPRGDPKKAAEYRAAASTLRSLAGRL